MSASNLTHVADRSVAASSTVPANTELGPWMFFGVVMSFVITLVGVGYVSYASF